MDITRNWRLKTSRSQLLATRNPVSGAVMLPGQNRTAAEFQPERYTFETLDEAEQAPVGEADASYARAAR